MVVSIQAKKISSSVFKESVAFMEKRYELMSLTQISSWEGTLHYGMTPKFILVDEWAL